MRVSVLAHSGQPNLRVLRGLVRGGLIWIFFTTEDTEHTEYFLGFEEGDFGQPGWSLRASTNPSSETGRRFLFSVSSVPSVVRKSGFELDFEHTIFVALVVKKIR